MAITVPQYPVSVWGGGEGFTGPPEIQFPIAATQTGAVGNVGIFSAGVLDITGNCAATTALLGFNAKTLVTAPAAGTPHPIRMILPTFLYEISGTGALTEATVTAFTTGAVLAANSTGALTQFAVSAAADTATGNHRILAFASRFGNFATGGFWDKTATAATAAPTLNRPMSEMGVDGDTAPRMIACFLPLKCFMTCTTTAG